ncbi:amidase [Pararhodobacter sp. SW119]|uniref:amidase n=1 Tax=Pararhodobacter sp. SW119 TaxID=2780075 RepID=UPI001ADFE952|nr:amidase [Pararhodobacter sp. SW119]
MATDHAEQDAVALAGMVSRREVSPEELLEAAIARAEAADPALNFLSQRLYDFGRREIARGLPDGPLTGVPFLLKDASADLAGTPTINGTRLLCDHLATADSTLVARYRAAGLVIFGKTTAPEFSLAASTESSLHGQTRNPWDRSRSAGGSSGGSGAAVAAGVVPMAHATDGGGSIRIPASCCGLFGLKPTRARVPHGPPSGEGWGSLSCAHVLTRTVRDSAALLDVAQGPAPGDPYAAPMRERSYLEEIARDLGKLRVAMQLRPLSGVAVDRACLQAAREAARLLSAHGHEVEETLPPGDGEELGHALWVLVATSVSGKLRAIGRRRRRAVTRDEVDATSWNAVEFACGLSVEDYPAALSVIHAQGRRMAAFHERFDILLSPTLAKPPVPLGELRTDTGDIRAYERALARFSPFTQLANMTGQPSMSVPLHTSDAGLPIGVMFTAPFGREDMLFRLAALLEAERPWSDRRPGRTR